MIASGITYSCLLCGHGDVTLLFCNLVFEGIVILILGNTMGEHSQSPPLALES